MPGRENTEYSVIPVAVHLPTTMRTERRNIAAREMLKRRVRAEFEEMPGLSVTLEEAAKLFGLTSAVGSRILLALIAERVLRQTADRRYVLLIRN